MGGISLAAAMMPHGLEAGSASALLAGAFV
jgi:hypothetical protein